MKVIWSNNENEILELVNHLINRGVSLTIQLRGKGGQAGRLRTRALKIHEYNGNDLLVLKRPEGLPLARKMAGVMFKARDLPILGFTCPIIRESSKHLATVIPSEIYKIELRQFPRYDAPRGSLLTFNVEERDKVTICVLKDISCGGVKLVGTPLYPLGEGDVIGPVTVSIAGFNEMIINEITLHKGTVMRALPIEKDKNRVEIGIRFELNDYEKEELEKQVQFIAADLDGDDDEAER